MSECNERNLDHTIKFYMSLLLLEDFLGFMFEKISDEIWEKISPAESTYWYTVMVMMCRHQEDSKRAHLFLMTNDIHCPLNLVEA